MVRLLYKETSVHHVPQCSSQEVLEGKEVEFGMGRDERTNGEEREKLERPKEGWTRNRGRRQRRQLWVQIPGEKMYAGEDRRKPARGTLRV